MEQGPVRSILLNSLSFSFPENFKQINEIILNWESILKIFG